MVRLVLSFFSSEDGEWRRSVRFLMFLMLPLCFDRVVLPYRVTFERQPCAGWANAYLDSFIF